MKHLSKIEEYSNVPSYNECVKMTLDNPQFYETKTSVDGFNISLFNYRLVNASDFSSKKSKEMRGICFVFNKDESLFKRYILLEKFFNLNQVEETMYSIVNKFKIKSVMNKEDGSISTFIKLPNGKIVGKSKMGFDNDQANSINRLYRNRDDIRKFVDWCLISDIVPIFEYVSPTNKIVLRYIEDDLILLRMRDNSTGRHLNIKDYLDKIGYIKIAPFKDDCTLDDMIENAKIETDKEGVVVQSTDQFGRDMFYKIKNLWYCERHGLLTNDIYREHIIIGYILDDKIDDVLGQIPEDEVESHSRINKIISIIRKVVDQKSNEISESYKVFKNMGSNRKNYALRNKKDPNFSYVMAMASGQDPYDLAKEWVRNNTKKLLISREFLKKQDPSLFFQEPDEDSQDN